MRSLLTGVVMLAALAWPHPSAAQTPNLVSPAQVVRTTRRPPRPVRLRAYVFYESTSLRATRTFEGLFDTTRTEGLGVGGELLGLWRGVFVRGAWSKATLEDGSRGFVIDDLLYLTNVPVTVEIAPFEIGVGWREPIDQAGRFAAYGGMSLLRVSYSESAEFATSDEQVETSETGYALFAGIDAVLWRQIFAGVEVQRRTVEDALGQDPDSVSGAFGETDLGGTVFRVLGGIRW